MMKRELNKYLASLTGKELINEIKKLYNKIPQVKEFYQLELSGDTSNVVNEYKEKIKKEYFPSRGYGQARNSVSKKVISDFKKISIHQKDVVELLLYRTEMMINFTDEYGDIDDPFYNSLASSYHQACKIIEKEKLEKYYRKYCQELVGKTMNFGWGVHYELKNIYHEYFATK